MRDAFAHWYFGFAQRVQGWDARAAVEELERLQWADPSEVEALRVERLRRLLRHCKQHVPFYREAFAESGFDPDELQSVADLVAVPFASKEEFRKDYRRFHAEGERRPVDTWNSSGSTGQPFTHSLDKNSTTRNTFAALIRARRWWGIEDGDREMSIWSVASDASGTWRGRWKAFKRRHSWMLRNILLVDCYDLDERQMRAYYERLLRFQPLSARCISSGLYRFCVLLEQFGLDGRALGIKNAIYTGEAFPDVQKEAVERILGCRAINEYGCSELGIMAFECPEGGIHLSHENHVFEFLKDGEPAAPGEPAELVVTNLNNFVAPYVRYRVGDLVVPSDRSCPCGRTMPLIESISGRTSSTIRTPSGVVVHGLFFAHLFDEQPAIDRFRVVQRTLHELRIEVTSNETLPREVLQDVERNCSKTMGEGVEVKVEQVADLGLVRSGKFQWLVSELDD